MTSIEWLYDQMIIAENIDYRAILKQAKEMHKQEIMQSYIDGSYTGCGCYDFMKEEEAEQYYNETYKKD